MTSVIRLLLTVVAAVVAGPYYYIQYLNNTTSELNRKPDKFPWPIQALAILIYEYTLFLLRDPSEQIQNMLLNTVRSSSLKIRNLLILFLDP